MASPTTAMVAPGRSPARRKWWRRRRSASNTVHAFCRD
jgi:hypothetical protein